MDANAGQPEMEISDLTYEIARPRTMAETASFLCRRGRFVTGPRNSGRSKVGPTRAVRPSAGTTAARRYYQRDGEHCGHEGERDGVLARQQRTVPRKMGRRSEKRQSWRSCQSITRVPQNDPEQPTRSSVSTTCIEPAKETRKDGLELMTAVYRPSKDGHFPGEKPRTLLPFSA
jgi:hypothetical protein